MKRKIILMIILLCVIILGMPNVKAADEVEYKPGDLVEVINPTGGKFQQFYIISTEFGE